MDQDPTELASPAESARTGTRTSARSPAIELITRGEPRRRWSVEQKQTIAAESLVPGVSPIAVARRYGISSGLLYNWRKALLAAQPGFAAGFARVEMAERERLAGPVPPVRPLLPAPTPQPAELIEIALPDGTTLRVAARIDPRALRGLVNALRR
jgi:transposase